MLIGYNHNIEEQKELLFWILSKNSVLFEIIQNAQSLGLNNYYIGAGCVCQSVWNFQNELDLMYGISDIDFVYFDEDLSFERENGFIRQIEQNFNHLSVKIDVKNQARVHLWYKEYYGYELQAYNSVESAINTWPTTATSIGVKITDGKFIVYAPFGLNDMFGQIVRANKTQITKDTYLQKCKKWCSKWDTLKVIEW